MSNTIHILGNLGSDPTLETFESGAIVCNLSVADSTRFRNAAGDLVERTTWHRVNVWGKQAENCKKYLSKGRQVYVTGELQQRTVKKADGTTQVYTQVRASRVDFVGRPKEAQDQTQELEPQTDDTLPQGEDEDKVVQTLLDNDIPI